MALQVWLPLRGDLNNYGLSDVTVTNSGATIDNNGKIGKCYVINTSETSNRLTISNPITDNMTNFSLCCWFYATAWNSNHTSGLFGARTTGSGAGILCSISNGTSYIFDDGTRFTGTLTNTLELNTWYHIAFVKNQNQKIIYINGQQIATQNNTNVTANIKNILSIGNDTVESYSGNGLKGKINDVRIYDHSLSEKEVKEISLGLVLHYKLNDSNTENLLPNSKLGNSWTYPTSSYSDKYNQKTITIPSDSVYTLSFEAKSTVNGDKIRTHYYNPNTTTTCISSQGITKYASDGNMDFTISNEWKLYWVIYNQTETTSTKNVICPRIVSGQGTGTVSVRNLKLEKGAKATPWTPASTDALYSQLGLNNNILYDCSGYKNNGTIYGSLTSNESTSRYDHSANFDGNTSCVVIPYNSVCPHNIFTVNLWFKKDAVGTKSYESLFAGPSGFEMDTRAGSASTLSLYMASTRGGSMFPLSFGLWQMITMVRDGTNEYYYLNGELKKTIEAKSMPTGTYYIGAWASVTQQNILAQISDFRLYVTPLSAEDILNLYQVNASIDNGGNIISNEFEEENTSKQQILKTGIVKVDNFLEINDKLKVLSDGSVFLLILHHNAPASNLFTSSNCWLNNGTNLYSALILLKNASWLLNLSEYEFLVCEKGTSSGTEHQCRWKQTSNPALSSTLSGYSVISGNSTRSWGLMNKNSYGCFHNGSSWWCCCGSYTAFNGGIPGFEDTVTTGYLDLYVKIPNEMIKGNIADFVKFYAKSILTNQLIEK